MITVDGDTSTNDMVSVMANGTTGNIIIDENILKLRNLQSILLCK